MSLEERAGYGERRKEKALQPVNSMGRECRIGFGWLMAQPGELLNYWYSDFK